LQYNVHGLTQGTPLLNHICQNIAPSALFISEHWQTPANLHKILNFSNEYTGFGLSAMSSIVQKSILRGRPWGGCAILIKSDLIAAVKVILLSDRVVILSLGKLTLVNVYLPCLSLSSVDIIGGILEEISGALEGLSLDHLIFGGDLYCNAHDKSAIATILRDFLLIHQLEFCDQNIGLDDRCTYHHASLEHKSYIDFLFMARAIRPSLTAYCILDHALNHSDHSVVSLSFAYNNNNLNIEALLSNETNSKPNNKPAMSTCLRWDKVDLAGYYEETFRTLDPLRVKMQLSYDHWYETASHYNNCTNDFNNSYRHRSTEDLNAFKKAAVAHVDECYSELTSSLNRAATAMIPSLQTNSLKFWWTQEANDLKAKSILSHREWLNNHKPRSGPIQEAMKNDKYRYKLYLRDQKKVNQDGINESLYNNLITKNSKCF